MQQLTPEQQSRLCPHCASAKHFASGVETLEDGTARRTPDRPFAYVLCGTGKDQIWICPGCLDMRDTLPEPSNVIDLGERREQKKRVCW